MLNDMHNPFEHLDAQSEMSAFAQFTPAEHAEYQTWLDECQAKLEPANDIILIDWEPNRWAIN